MSQGPTIEDIKAAAQARIFEVLRACGINEAPSPAGYISMCNPVVKDRHPSFTIWTKGAAVGAWRDERNRGPGGDQGDIIDLVSYLNGWWSRPKKGRGEALRFLIDRLGLARVDPARLREDRDRARRAQLAREKHFAEDLAEKRGKAFNLFASAGARVFEDPVRTYLESRGIALGLLPRGPRGGLRVPNIIRGLAKHRHTESGQELPCMIAGCVCPIDWEIRAVHRTWLKPDCSGKADVNPVKKVWPSFAGLIVPLWRGETDLSVRDANACGLRETLVLTEGIEDGLTAALAAPRYRTWAFIALGNLPNIALPDCIDGVILHRQSEWHNRTAVSAFERGKRALEGQGRPVAEVTAFAGKDLNDTLRAGGSRFAAGENRGAA